MIAALSDACLCSSAGGMLMALRRLVCMQTGDPNPTDDSNPVHGYVVNGKERTVPLEIMALEDKLPTYGV
jgi:hypothetical protein